MVEKVERLEILRQNKQYRQVLDSISFDEPFGTPGLLPIAIDSARGLIQRSVFPVEISQIHFQLMNIGSDCLTNPQYLDLVDKDFVSAISHRRDLSRYFWAISSTISPTYSDFHEDSFRLLNKVDQLTSKNDWHKALIGIERQNKLVKSGDRVNLDDTFINLKELSETLKNNADASKAVSVWSLETVLLQSRLSVPNYFSVINNDLTFPEKIKFVAGVCLRLTKEKSRDYLLSLRRSDLSVNDRGLIIKQLQTISNLWTG